MDSVKIWILAMLCATGYQLTAGGAPELKTQNTIAGSRSIMFRQNAYAIPRSFNEYQAYRQMQITGFTLAGVGLGSIGAGSYMAYVGGTRIANTVTNSIENEKALRINRRDKGLVIGGSALAVLGLVLTPAGLAVGIKGSILRHRYNHTSTRSMLYIKPALKSVGVTCTF